MSHYFKDGATVTHVQLRDTTEYDIRTEQRMEISMEPGHMGMIPCVKITHPGGSVSMVSVFEVNEVLLADDTCE